MTCAVQPAEIAEANTIKLLEGCIMKRIARHDKATGKGRQDIEKAIHEARLILKLRYGDDVDAANSSEFEPWTPWEGGERPVDGVCKTLVKLRDGRQLHMSAGSLSWLWCDDEGADIVAYRVMDTHS